MNVLTHRFAPKIDLPLRYFVYGLFCLGVFAVLLPLFSDEVLAQHHYTHDTLALTHLLVLGWITSIIIGAVTQLVPIALGTQLYSEKLSRLVFWFFSLGVIGMASSFWVWNIRLLLWFGSSVTIGLALFIYNMVCTLVRAQTRDIVFVHIFTSIFYLMLTFLAGQYLIHDKIISFSPFYVLSAIHAHAHLAVIGWFMMMIMGISYRLVPMFLLSEIQSLKRAWLAYGIINFALPILFFGILFQKEWLPVAGIIIAMGMGLWLWELIAMIAMRKRRVLDATFKHLQIALWHVPVIILVGIWLSFPDGQMKLLKSQIQTGYGLLVLMGFISVFILSMLYKIIPFLVWYHIYPPLVGRKPVPNLKDLYSEKMEAVSMKCLMLGIWLTSMSASLAYVIPIFIIEISSIILGIGLLLNIVNLGLPILHWIQHAKYFTWDRMVPIRKQIITN